MTSDDPAFKGFSDFGIDETPAEGPVSRRLLRRREDHDNAAAAGPTTTASRAARPRALSHTPWSNSRLN